MKFLKASLFMLSIALLFNACSSDEEGVIPSASFSFDVNERTVSFNNTSKDGETYAWNFGDGNTSTTQSPTHTYASDGTYDVELTVTNESGTAKSTKSVSVSETFVAPELGYVLAFKSTGDTEAEFILEVDDLMTGEIDAQGKGIEQTGWRFFYPAGKSLFASGYSEDNQCAGYQNDGNGGITKVGEFIFENSLEMFGSDDNTLLAMEIPRAGFTDRRLHFVDANTSFVTKIVGTRIFENTEDSLVAWPTALKVRGDKLYIPFQLLHASGNFATPAPDAAHVAIYDYPNVGAEPIAVITDDRTSNIGVNGSSTGLISTDNGDLYSFSCGAEMAGFAPKSTKPSGILKIASGSDAFDEDYFFDIEAETGGGKLFWMDHVGGNKAIARIILEDNAGPWAAYGRSVFNQKLVIIDLDAKTITDVANVPLNAKRYSSPVFLEDGKAYVSIETAEDVHIYSVDIDSATGTKGAKVNGKTIKGIFKLPL